MRYVSVILDLNNDNTDRFYTYAAPDDVFIGALVLIPFARRRDSVQGYVIETDIIPDIDANKIRNVKAIDYERSLNEEIIETSLWMRNRLGIRYIDAIKRFAHNGNLYNNDIIPDSEIDTNLPILSEEQRAAVSAINDSIESEQFAAYLIHGVTGSGKTEIYMRAAAHTLELGKTCIILLPEIAISNQVESLFCKRFGAKNIAILHSRLSKKTRNSEWLRIKRGEAKIVIGARSSVFAPLTNIGLIVIDEEHEPSYKSDRTPRFETVDIAYKRAKNFNAVLVSGSATPSIVSYYRAKQGIYKLINLKHRVNDARLPKCELVDMLQEFRKGNTSCLSTVLREQIDLALTNKQKIILFINRRGFYTMTECLDCGFIYRCESCNIPLTYHKSSNASVCHYCGKSHPPISVCPSCGSKHIKFSGFGTEHIGDEIKKNWPWANVLRLDSDTAGSNIKLREIISKFQHDDTQIMVGTQMLAKGLDFQNVALVGIINADLSLHIPDFRADERTFQLICQVAGRAGRSNQESKVIIQTEQIKSRVIQLARSYDYETFYNEEIKRRELMKYPPFADIIRLEFEAGSDSMQLAHKFSQIVNAKLGGSSIQVLSPRLVKNQHTRAELLIKAPIKARYQIIAMYFQMKQSILQSKLEATLDIDINPS